MTLRVEVPDVSLFRGMSVERIRESTPGELAAWCRERRAELGVELEGMTCPTCGGDGVIDNGWSWCPDCTGNGIALPPTCRRCRGAGVVRAKDKPSIGTCPDCLGGAARLDGVLDRAGVPRFYQTFTWESYKALPRPTRSQVNALEAVYALSQDPSSHRQRTGRVGICLTGPAGTRKTGICVPAFSSLAQASRDASFVSWRSWLDRLAATWRADSGPSMADMIQQAVDAAVLMVDDFGGAGGDDRREWVAEAAWKLLEGRQSNPGPVLLTTNRTEAEIGRSFGEAVASRLAAVCAVMEVRGADERRRQ